MGKGYPVDRNNVSCVLTALLALRYGNGVVICYRIAGHVKHTAKMVSIGRPFRMTATGVILWLFGLRGQRYEQLEQTHHRRAWRDSPQPI